MVWMIFLVGSAAYWLELVIGEIRDVGKRTVEVTNASGFVAACQPFFSAPFGMESQYCDRHRRLGAQSMFQYLFC